MRIATLIPTLTFLGAAGAATAADDLDLQFHGYASQGYLLSRNNALYSPESEDHGTFELNEFAVNVVANPVNRLRVGVQIFAQDLGDSGNNKPQIDWAYGNYSFPAIGALDLGFSAGRVKVGHGLYNDYRDLDMTRTSVFLPTTVYNPRFRDFYLAINGAMLDGSIGAGPMGSFDFAVYVGSQNIDDDEGAVHDIFADLGVSPISRLAIDAANGANVTWNTPIEGLRLKYSLQGLRGFHVSGTMAAGGTLPFAAGTAFVFNASNVWDNIASIEYQRDRLTLAGEYSYFYFKGTIDGTIDINGPAPGGLIPVSNPTYQVMDSAYISASYRLPFFDDKLEVQGAWLWSKIDLVSNGQSNTVGWTAAVRYDVVDHWLIKAEYGWFDGAGGVRRNEQYDRTVEPVWGYFALKTTFDF